MRHVCRALLVMGPALAGLGCGYLVGIETLQECPSFDRPVYVTGSDTIVPMFEGLGVGQEGSQLDLQIVYLEDRSCRGARAVAKDPPVMRGDVRVWGYKVNGDLVEPYRCQLAPQTVDIGVSDAFAESCGVERRELLDDFHGPIQAVFFVVPSKSAVSSISLSEAQNVYDTGQHLRTDHPWRDPRILRRDPDSGTQNLIAQAIGVESRAFRGYPYYEKASHLIGVIDATTQEEIATSTIGIFDIPSDTARGAHKRLGYDSGAGAGAVWPSKEKEGNAQENVRDGSYPLWGPLHMLVRKNDLDSERQTRICELVNAVAIGSDPGGEICPKAPAPPAEDVDLLRKIIDARFVPACAMDVGRAADGELSTDYALPLVPDSAAKDPPRSAGGGYTKPTFATPCRCFYDAVVSTTTCDACDADHECTAPDVCSFGYCETPCATDAECEERCAMDANAGCKSATCVAGFCKR